MVSLKAAFDVGARSALRCSNNTRRVRSKKGLYLANEGRAKKKNNDEILPSGSNQSATFAVRARLYTRELAQLSGQAEEEKKNCKKSIIYILLYCRGRKREREREMSLAIVTCDTTAEAAEAGSDRGWPNLACCSLRRRQNLGALAQALAPCIYAILTKSINNCEEEEEQLEFLCKIRSLIGERRVPNFRKIFRHKEIDCLLLDSMNYWKGVQYDTLKLFIKFVARIGYKDKPEVDKNGKLVSCRTTAVHLAAKHKYDHHLIDVLFKIYNKFDVNYTDESGLTHFHAACQSGCDDIVSKFLEFGQDPNCIWRETGDTPLHLALVFGRKKTVEMLLMRDANPFVPNKDGLTPLHVVCRNFPNAHELVKMLFELSNEKYHPVQVDAQDNLGKTPLHYVLSRNHKIQNTVRLLLENGASPNLADKEGLTPLHYIFKRRGVFYDDYKEDDLKIFFKINEAQNQTVEVNGRDKLGNTPLHLALECVNRNFKKVVEVLLRRGADPNVANAEGSTPLHLICDKLSVYDSNEDLVELFFKINDERHQPVEVNAMDNSGQTPLQIAVANLEFRGIAQSAHYLYANAESKDMASAKFRRRNDDENDDGFVHGNKMRSILRKSRENVEFLKSDL
uniref:Uncharacterized protein n=1 Tax=Trichogramma kaykai TaxID=54128 RepID=A0ABD2XC71_9HYME